jgi:flagellar export protein FliJ
MGRYAGKPAQARVVAALEGSPGAGDGRRALAVALGYREVLRGGARYTNGQHRFGLVVVMTTFTFRLEKVLRWRQAKLDLEQFALSRLLAESARWGAVIAKLEGARREAENAVLSSGPVAGGDLAALATYQARVQKERQISLDRRRDCERRIEQQRAKVLAARREFRLLEKLRQVRRTEWETAVNREFEDLAAETYLARWAPRPRPAQ